MTPGRHFRSGVFWRRRKSLWLGLVIFQLTVLAGGLIYQATASANDQRHFPPPGKLIDIGGYRLHLYCTGERTVGVPTVVFEGGLGASSVMWAVVQPSVAEHTRACSYDRAGYGWSDPGPQPRTAQQIVGELHSLLQLAGESAPYVLVGHSFGGMVARIYAAEHPDEMVGLILVDARHEDFFNRMPPAYLQTDQRNLSRARLLKLITPLGITRLLGTAGRLDAFEAYLAPLPTDTRAAAWAMMIYNPQHWSTAVAEREAIEESYQQVKASTLPDKLPLIVLTAENGIEAWQPPGQTVDEQSRATWMKLQEELAGLSTQSKWIIVPGSGHYIHLEQPAAVIEAVLTLLAA